MPRPATRTAWIEEFILCAHALLPRLSAKQLVDEATQQWDERIGELFNADLAAELFAMPEPEGAPSTCRLRPPENGTHAPLA